MLFYPKHSKITLHKHSQKTVYVDMFAVMSVEWICVCLLAIISSSEHTHIIDLTIPPIDRTNQDPIFYGEITKSTPKKERFLNIIILPNDKICYYIGLDVAQSDTIEAKTSQISWMINQHLHKYSPICKLEKDKKCWDPIFIIRPQADSRYECFIWVLSAMEIAGARKYTVPMD